MPYDQRKHDTKKSIQWMKDIKMCRKKLSVGEIKLLAVVWGLERFTFHLYGKRIQLFSGFQALEALLKSNKQYSARLTRWLDRLNHFDITLKHTVGKKLIQGFYQ